MDTVKRITYYGMWNDTATIIGSSHLLCIQLQQTIKALNTFMSALFTSLVKQFSAALADEGSKFKQFIESLLLVNGRKEECHLRYLLITFEQHPLWKPFVTTLGCFKLVLKLSILFCQLVIRVQLLLST